MVMRRVFNHHVCLCVLSTAILAGLALMTSQNKVYAAQNCKGLANGNQDKGNQPIVCDGGANGTGWGNGTAARDGEWGELSGKRDIDMSGHSDKAAVTVYNGRGRETKIRIKSKLTVTNKSGKNNNPAIKVYNKGELVLVGDVSIENVQKGIVVEGRGSSVTVMTGSIGVGAKGGGSLIEVKDGGEVMLMREVTMTGSGSGDGVGVLIENGGEVTLMKGVTMTDVKTGMKIMGNGNASVKGGATIEVGHSGTGVEVDGTANANVVDMTIMGKGTGAGVLINGRGTVVMTKVTMKDVAMGARVSNGVLEMIGKSTIAVGGNGTGLEVKGGKVMMMGGSITGNGNTGTGVEVSGMNATVTMMGVTLKDVDTGARVSGGTLTLNGGSTIKVGGVGGNGVSVSGGDVVMMGKTTINVTGVGMGLNVTDGTLTVTGTTTIEVGGSGGTGMYAKSGTLMMSGMTTIEVGAGGKGMEVGGSAMVMMTGGSLTITGKGSGTGVMVSGSADVTLERVNISGVQTGVEVTGSGKLTMENGEIRFTGTYGVMVGSSVTSASLTNVTIMGENKGKGVVMKGGTVTMMRVNISEVGTGVEVDGGTLTVEGGEIRFTGTYGVSVGAGVTSASLTGTKIVGRGKTGVLMGSTGTLTLERVNISGFAKGVQMTGGTLMVREGMIVGNNSGTGVDVTGGANVTLTSVNISQVETGIYMEAGESLTVREGTINFMGAYGVSVGAGVTSASLTGTKIVGRGKTGVLMGSTGTLTLERVNISGVQTGVEVTGSGKLTMENGEIRFTGAYGVYVGKSVTEATLADVTISGENKGIGVYAEGEKMMMTKVNISQVQTGIYAMGSGELKVEDGTRIEFMGDYGVMVGKGVRAELTDVTIVGKGKGYGVLMTGSTVVMKQVGISQVATGVEMKKGTLIMKEGTKINFTGKYGVMVGSSVTSASLTDVTIVGNKSGYGVLMTGGTVMMTKVNVSNVERGIAMSGNGTLIGVNISQAGMGIYAMGGKSLTVREGTIRFTGAYGVMVEGGVTRATLTGTKIVGRGSVNGVGVYAMGGNLTVSGVGISKVETGVEMRSGSLTINEGTTIQFTGKYGVMVGSSVTSASLTDVTIEGNKSGYGVLKVKDNTRIEFMGSDGYGVYVEGGVRAELTDVTIVGRGDGYGVYAEGGKVTVKGGTRITGVKAGIYATGYGVLKVKDKTRIEFVGKYGYGIYVGEGVRADLTDVTITGRGSGVEDRTGVWVMGGKMVMDRVDISNVGTGVVMSDGAMWLKETHLRNVAKGMTIEEGVVVMVEGSVEFKGEHGIYFKQGRAALKGITMTYKSDGLNANFIKVEGGKVLAENLTITGNGGKGQGVKVANGGTVWLKETHFTNVKSGMSISEGSVFMFKGGITFKGDYGIYLSKGQALLSDFNITGPGGTSKTTGIGVVVSSLGEVMMREVNISGVEMGAYMTGGLLVMDKGSITFKGDYGINLIRGHAFLNGVNITGSGDKKSTGIELGYGQVLMKGTTFTNVDKAMTVTEGDVRMEGGEITFTGEHGILLNQGGVALMGVRMTYLCFHVCFFFCIVCECFVYFFLF
ncbi:right-handed parallel beta-helix repeat-containing protein [Bartonella schoenbuchensis]|uniref:right-handed parallel beta-helix repeat-containing protein n=1 Tax=Bartonella schoenbuchensis TaxID=165694 RepID=UPI0031CCA1F9